MDVEPLIRDLEERIKEIESQIKNCEKRIKHAGFSHDYDAEIEELEKNKQQLEKNVNKLKEGNFSMIETLMLPTENLIHQLTEKIRKLSETATIRARDKKLMKEYLIKHNKEVNHYSMHIDVITLETKGRELIAERTITIKNKDTLQSRQYTAGQSTNQLWFTDFDKDLEAGKI